MKENVRKECHRRIGVILKSEVNAANRFKAINTLAVPIVTYSFNIINWKMNEIKKLETETRKLLTIQRMHHPKADVDRLYLPRTPSGGGGLIQIETTFKTITVGLETYLKHLEDTLLQLVWEHEKRKKLYYIQKEGKKFRQELDVPNLEKG